MTAAVQAAFPRVMMAPTRSSYQDRLLFRCSCETRQCFKAVLIQSVLRSKTLRPPCPTHQVARAGSKLAKAFANILFDIDSTARVVWDYHCVPDRPKMSIDVCMQSGARWHLFELDGSGHFYSNFTRRNDIDVQKDAAMNGAGMGMLRLHYRDQEKWPAYTREFMQLQSRPTCVKYTESYRDCIAGEVEEDDVIKLG